MCLNKCIFQPGKVDYASKVWSGGRINIFLKGKHIIIIFL